MSDAPDMEKFEGLVRRLFESYGSVTGAEWETVKGMDVSPAKILDAYAALEAENAELRAQNKTMAKDINEWQGCTVLCSGCGSTYPFTDEDGCCLTCGADCEVTFSAEPGADDE